MRAVRTNVTIDWTVRENVRAQLRVLVKRILRKYGYPPDKQEKATQTVLEQAELLGFERVESGDSSAASDPFLVVPPAKSSRTSTPIPLYSLAVAAGAFGDGQVPEAEAWVRPSRPHGAEAGLVRCQGRR